MKKLVFPALLALLISTTGCFTINRVKTKRDLVYPRYEVESENIQKGIDCLVQGLKLVWDSDNMVVMSEVLERMQAVAHALQIASGIPIAPISITSIDEVNALKENILSDTEANNVAKKDFVTKHDRKQAPGKVPAKGFNWRFWLWMCGITIIILGVFAPSVLILLWKKMKLAGKAAKSYLEEIEEQAKEKLAIQELADKSVRQIVQGVESLKEAHPDMKDKINKHVGGKQDSEVEEIVNTIKTSDKNIF